MIGVFSANNVLLASNLLNRVQDAIDAGVDGVRELDTRLGVVLGERAASCP